MWLDKTLIVETYGNASAMHAIDLSVATQPVNVTQIGGVVQSLTDFKDFVDAGYDPATHKVQGVVLCDTTTTNTDMLTAAAVNAEVDTALNTAIPGGPTANSINERIVAIDDDLPNVHTHASNADTQTVAGTIGDAVLDEVVEGTTTLRKAVNLHSAVLAGKASGGGTNTITYRDLGDSKNRAVQTVDVDGNRSAVVNDGA